MSKENKNPYQSTVKMNFYGQDKESKQVMGNNPNSVKNDREEEEYIQNLQQQIHFMELELKILKEKVIEDEKKSGIGSLYDDDKTSLQHIYMLKQKYRKMLRDFHLEYEKKQKEQMKVMGEQGVLSAQLDFLKKLSGEQKEEKNAFDQESQQRDNDITKKKREANKLQSDLDKEKNSLEDQHKKASADHLKNKIELDSDAKREEVRAQRHTDQAEEDAKLIEKKKAELADLQQKIADQKAIFEGMADLQAQIARMKELEVLIEKGKVEVQKLKIENDILKTSTDALQTRKDDLKQQKDDAERLREELKKSAQTKKDQAEKRIQQKLARDKTPKITELKTQEEQLKQQNEEMRNKLKEEKEKYEKFLFERMKLDELARRQKEKMQADIKFAEEQDKLLEELKAQIATEQATNEDLSEKLKDAKMKNKQATQKNRDWMQTKVALQSKLKFIMETYDYKDRVEAIETEIFSKVKKTNEDVNSTVDTFMKRMEDVKKETTQFIAEKNAMAQMQESL